MHRKLPLDGQRILIADDDGLLSDVLARRLVTSGATVVTATTTDDALRQTDRHQPSLSIIDLELRGRGTGALRQALYERHIPFVVYTALHHRARIGRWAAMPLIYKPDECGEVERAVVRLASQPSRWPWPAS
jgi:DNA-binding response OmpR family regulator